MKRIAAASGPALPLAVIIVLFISAILPLIPAQAQGLSYPAQMNKSFSPISIPAGSTSTLSVNIYNPNSFPLSLSTNPPAWTDTLPANVSFASPLNISTDCGGTVTTAGGTLSLLGGTVPAQVGTTPGSCTVSVDVTSTTAGNHVNTIPANSLRSTDPTGAIAITNTTPASATLSVNTVQPPSLSKTFTPNTIWIGQTSVLTINITNNDANAALTQTTLSDSLPANVTVANPPLPAGWNTNCGATASVTGPGGGALAAGNTALTINNATIAAGTTCTVQVNVTSLVPGIYMNSIPARAVQTRQAVTNGSAATAPLNAQAIGISKSFAPANFQQGGVTTLTISLQNPSSSDYDGVSFQDDLPAGLTIASPPVSPQCGGTVTSTATSLTLTGGTIPAGSITTPGSCTVTVQVTSSTAASYTNVIPAGALTTSQGATNVLPATANVSVYGTGLGISGSKGFSPTTIAVGGTSRLSINITAPADIDLTNFSISDSLPAGLYVSSNPNPTKNANCAGSSFTALPGDTLLTYSGGSIAKGTTCTLAVNVTSSAQGTYTNTLPPANITNTQGRNLSGNLTASLTVSGLSVSKVFAPTRVNPLGISLLTITLTNTNTSQLDNVSVSDPLPYNTLPTDGIFVAPTPNASTTCNGLTPAALTAAPGSSTVTMTGGTIPAQVGSVPGICTITLNVIGRGGARTYTNTIPAGGASGILHGTGTVVSNPSQAQANIRVDAVTISVVKAFNPLTVFGGSASTLTVQVTNPNTVALNGIAFTDNLPQGVGGGMYVANPANPSVGTCGGTITAAPGATSFSFTGGSLPANTSCTLTLRVSMNVNDNLTNTIPAGSVTSTNGAANPQAASATLTNLPGASVSKSFGPNPILVGAGNSSTMTIVIQNTGNFQLTGMGLSDTLPTGMTFLTPPAAGQCGGTVTSTANSLTLAGGVLAGSSSCTITATVTAPNSGAYQNCIPVNALTNNEGARNQSAACDTLTVFSPPAIRKAFAPVTIPAGANSVLTFTLTNPNTAALTGVSFTDTFPSGLTISSVPNPGQCGGLVTSTPDSITLTGGSIPAQVGINPGSCTVVVSATSPTGGSYVNTSGAVSSTNGGTGGSASATLTVVAPPTLQKSFGPNPIAVGGTSTLTFTLRNPVENTVALTGVAFSDTYPFGLVNRTPPAATNNCGGTLTATAGGGMLSLTGGSIPVRGSCTITVQVTAANGGPHLNTTSPITSTNGGAGGTASDTLNVNGGGLTLLKSTTTTGYQAPGETITYNYLLTNSGSVTLYAPFRVSDDHIGAPAGTAFDCGAVPSLAPLATVSCSAAYTVQPGDVTTRLVTNRATATAMDAAVGGNTVTSNASSVTVRLEALNLQKSTTTAGYRTAGTVIPYGYTLTNTGGVTLYPPFEVTDDHIGTPPGTAFVCGTPASLPPGGTLTCTRNYTVTAADLTSGLVTNTAAASAEDSAGRAVASNQARVTVYAVYPPSMNKVFSPATVPVGTASTLTFTITNPPQNVVPLSGVGFTDTFPAGLTVAAAPLASQCGGTVTYTANSITLSGGTLLPANSCTVTVSVIAGTRGSYPNTSGAVNSTNGGPGNPASATLTVLAPPTLAKAFSPTSVLLGQTATLTFTLTNPNPSSTLTGIAFNDPLPAGLVVAAAPNAGVTGCNAASVPVFAPAPGDTSLSFSAGSLAGGASCSLHVDVTGSTTGLKSNTTGPVTSSEGGTGNPSNTAVLAVNSPSLTLEKSIAAGSPYAAVGDVIQYSYLLTNTGNVTLIGSGPGGVLTVTDDKAAVICPATPAGLAAGASITCTSSYTVTLADLDSGSVVNHATAHGLFGTLPVDSNEDTATASAAQSPALTLAKSITSGSPYDAVGDVIQYSYLLTNSGNVTLTGNGAGGVFTVTDDKTTVTCPASPTSLAPGASVTCTAGYTVTQADLDNGTVVNRAAGHALFGATPVDSNEDTETANATQSPALTLAKSITSGSPYDAVGDAIQYSYLLTNSGNVTITGNGAGSAFTVTDDKTVVTCPASPTSLAPGASVTCTASYAVTQADLDNGTVVNHATGHALFGTTPVDSNEAVQTANATQSPVLALAKSITSGSPYDSAGDVIQYQYVLTNNGNVTVTGSGTGGVFTVTDDRATVTCPASPTSLAPGASVTCTASYTVTNADLGGEVVNRATGQALSGSTPVSSNQDRAVATGAPVLTITKDDGLDVAAPGGLLEYVLVVTNTSLQQATGVVLTDELPRGTQFISATDGGTYDPGTGVISWPAFALDAGASRQFRLTVQVESADLLRQHEAFEIVNNANVADDGTHSGGSPVEAQASDTDKVALDSVKTLTGTEQSGSSDPKVLIGEMLDYSISLDVPPGAINNLQAVDILDPGLAFVGCSLNAPISSGTLVLAKNPCTDPAALTVQAEPVTDVDPASPNAGRHITFDFGRVQNQSQEPQTLTLNYRVIVLNISSNHDGVGGLNNRVQWLWEGGTLSGEASPVEIIEPLLSIEKTVDPSVAIVGSTVKFTIRVSHSPGSSAPAYEVQVTDKIPAGLQLDQTSIQAIGSSGLPAPVINKSAAQFSVYWSEFPLTAEAEITFQAVFLGPPPVANTASVEWASILVDPDPNLTPLSAYNQHSTERRYDPASSALNNYTASARASLTVPELPQTGFAPGRITALPAQPADRKYEGLGDLWLEVPRLDLKVSIVGIPNVKGDWDLKWLGAGQAGYLNGTAYPTHAGNSFLTAHVYQADGKPGPFHDLQSLRWGDEVRIHMSGQVYIYQVRSNATLSAADSTIFKHEEYPWLTLLTCRDYNAASDSYARRVAVRAVLVRVVDELAGR